MWKFPTIYIYGKHLFSNSQPNSLSINSLFKTEISHFSFCITMVPSQSNTTTPTVSPPPSTPEAVDLLRCNHQTLCYRFTRKLKRYLGCLKSKDSKSLETKNNKVAATSSCSHSMTLSPNYYSDMNPEERDEKLKSAIVYCKNWIYY